MEKVLLPKVPHKIIHGILAAVYAAACIGLDETIASALLALGYVVLAIR